MQSKTQKEIISSIYNTPIQAKVIVMLKDSRYIETEALIRDSLKELDSLKKRYEQALGILEITNDYLTESINATIGDGNLVS